MEMHTKLPIENGKKEKETKKRKMNIFYIRSTHVFPIIIRYWIFVLSAGRTLKS